VSADAVLRARPALALSVLLPGLAAAALTAALVQPWEPTSGPEPSTAPVPAVRPLAQLESLSGGIRPAPPARISIPAAGAAGPVDPISEVHGQLEIPPPGRAGWFEAGPRPGEPGQAVIVSHVDSDVGPALFASLRSLHPASRIVVRDQRGRAHRFELVRRVQIQKTSFPARSVYRAARRPLLVLITCGGPFTPGEGYRDNVIIFARAV
jgi:sortase family protein